MIHDFGQRKVYRLVFATAYQRLAAHRKQHEKATYSKAKANARVRAKSQGQEPEIVAPPLLLCNGMRLTLDTVYRLAFDACQMPRRRPTPQAVARNTHLRRAGVSPKASRPKFTPFDSPTKHLRLRTSQGGLAVTCSCSVRTLQRHLDIFETLDFVLHRKQLGVHKSGSPTYALTLSADFLDWQEIQVFDHGTTVADGAENGPVGPPAVPAAPNTAESHAEPPGGPPDALAAYSALQARLLSPGMDT